MDISHSKEKSWVEIDPTTTLLAVESEDDNDSVEGIPPEDNSLETPSDKILAEFNRIRVHLGLPEFPLKLRFRKDAKYNGFVSGRIYHRLDVPLRMVLNVCPNADDAEIFATLVHEFAHLFGHDGHGIEFKTKMVELAKAIYGDDYFCAAEERLSERYNTVDCWVTVGIRCSLTNQPVPQAVEPGSEKLAKVLSRVQKMQRLAARHPGTEEAKHAAASANTMITRYNLQAHKILLPDHQIDEQKADMFLYVGNRVPWRVDLVHSLARFCNCFSLNTVGTGTMHLFGKYGDLVRCKFLAENAIAQLQRSCDTYIEEEKKTRKFERGEGRRLRASFLNTAADSFGVKLYRMKMKEAEQAESCPTSVESQATALARADLENAKNFAMDLFLAKKRPTWRSGGSTRKTYYNADGAAAGRSVSLNGGVGGKSVKRLT